MISEYLRDLRALIGTRLVLVPSAAVLFRDDRGRILLVRSVGATRWVTVGGAVDPGEDPSEAARREAIEEVGIEPVDLRLLGVIGGPDHFVRYAHGDEVSYVASVFEARTGGATPTPDGEEIEEAAWFDLDDVVTLPLTTTTASILGRFSDSLRGSVPGPIRGIEHVQLAMPAREEAAARAFYVGVLGMVEEPKPANLAARGGAWFRGGSARLHLGVETEFRPAKKAHPALRVDDLVALIERLRAAGYGPVTDEPLEGFDRCYVSDPFGNRIELLQPTER